MPLFIGVLNFCQIYDFFVYKTPYWGKNACAGNLKSAWRVKKIFFFVLPNKKSITFANTSENIIK